MKQTKVYITGSLKAQQRIGKEIAKLSRLGNFDILTSRLLDVNPKNHRDIYDISIRDIYAILEADLVIVDTITPLSTGDHDIDLEAVIIKYLQRGRHIIRIGPARNVFHSLIREKYKTWGEFLTTTRKNSK